MELIVFWLTNYSSILTVVIAFLGVAVAGVYAILTWLLAKAAKVQADAARIQATAAADRARAGADQASAAADQARIARQVFEASHRPYLEARVDARTHSAGAGRADVETFKNC